jgi:hypothetical protein
MAALTLTSPPHSEQLGKTKDLPRVKCMTRDVRQGAIVRIGR